MKVGGSLVGDAGRVLVAAKRYLIALYIANLILGWFATFGLSSRIGAVTGTSLYAERLVHGLDLGAFLELINKPEIAPYSQAPLALAFSAIFVAFQLFLTGGIITQYLTAAESVDRNRFYASCGENFWRMLRIAIVFFLAAGLVGGVLHVVRSGLDSATENSSLRAGLTLQCGMLLIEALALLWLRMWFDLAQTELIASGARRIRSSLTAGFKSARTAAPLYAAYVFNGILTLLVGALGTYVWWTWVPPSRVVMSFLILQSTLACLLILRWWQRALAAAWYVRNNPLPVAAASVVLAPLPPESAVPEVPLSQ